MKFWALVDIHIINFFAIIDFFVKITYQPAKFQIKEYNTPLFIWWGIPPSPGLKSKKSPVLIGLMILFLFLEF